MPYPHPIQQNLITALSLPLPGNSAHQKMAVPGSGLFSSIPDHAKKAAVLILFYHRVDRIFIAFIKRKQYDTDRHGGQISFPGGKMEVEDDYPIQTALREAQEEISIGPGVEILGILSPLYIPVSNFYVSPVLAWHQDLNPRFTIQENEVDELIEVDLGLILHPSTKTQKSISVLTNYMLKSVPAYEVNGHVIWGATAMILREVEWMLRGE